MKKAGLRIVGFGASHSTTTLTCHFGLNEFSEYIAYDNLGKHGTYSTGYRIPVVAPSVLYADKPDVVLVLAWQHADSIIKRHRSLLEGGSRFLIPLPNLVELRN